MQQILKINNNIDTLSKIEFIVGDKSSFENAEKVQALEPFCSDVVNFLDKFSRILMSSRLAKSFPDVITLGFWCRKSSILKMKDTYMKNESNRIYLGRGIAFHIAPSNVPVNYAYSLVTGLLCGNVNIVRIPTKNFPQVDIINSAINQAIEACPLMKSYVYLVRYERIKAINDLLSSVSNVRIVWGGDKTISELRKSDIPSRTIEVNFADRYSIAIIDSDEYLKIENKNAFAEQFYNDTYLTDQNACTSPRVVVWTGNEKENAKEIFWSTLHSFADKKYQIQPVMAVNKLTNSMLFSASHKDVKVETVKDNLIYRIQISEIYEDLMDYRGNTGYFFEYNCDDILDLKNLCDDVHCQTIGFLGKKEEMMSLIMSGVHGIDRVVPIGKTMDFNLVWDGYNLFEKLTRIIDIQV